MVKESAARHTSGLTVLPEEMPEALQEIHRAVVAGTSLEDANGELLEQYLLHCNAKRIKVPLAVCQATLWHFARILNGPDGALTPVQNKMRTALIRLIHAQDTVTSETQERSIASDQTVPNQPVLPSDE